MWSWGRMAGLCSEGLHRAPFICRDQDKRDRGRRATRGRGEAEEAPERPGSQATPPSTMRVCVMRVSPRDPRSLRPSCPSSLKGTFQSVRARVGRGPSTLDALDLDALGPVVSTESGKSVP